MDNSNNSVQILKIFVYGIVSPLIISVGIYYTFNVGFKNLIKDAFNEVLTSVLENSIKKCLRETFNLKKIK
jgi:hypothetical protein